LNKVVLNHEKPVEFVDNEKIVLNAEGNYPRRIVIRDRRGLRTEYRLFKTKSGHYILNK